MRRFSQRSHLVTLSEINITPLLDLAFVLLIIFVITTPLLTQSIDLHLPHGGKQEHKLRSTDVRTVEISNTGVYKYQARQLTLSQILANLSKDFNANTNLVVYVRADKECRYDLVAQLLDGCEHYRISRFSLRTDPTPPK